MAVPGRIAVMWEIPSEAAARRWGCGRLAVCQAHSPTSFLWHVSHFLNQRKRPGVAGERGEGKKNLLLRERGGGGVRKGYGIM